MASIGVDIIIENMIDFKSRHASDKFDSNND